jgi:hypothetical protein
MKLLLERTYERKAQFNDQTPKTTSHLNDGNAYTEATVRPHGNPHRIEKPEPLDNAWHEVGVLESLARANRHRLRLRLMIRPRSA